MNRARDQLLARPALALDQHRDRARRDLGQALQPAFEARIDRRQPRQRIANVHDLRAG
jgi:hypothetical protein